MKKNFLLPMFVLGGLTLFAFRPIQNETKIIKLENGNFRVEGNQLLAEELANLEKESEGSASYISFRQTTANFVMRSEFLEIDASTTFDGSDLVFKKKLDDIIAKYN